MVNALREVSLRDIPRAFSVSSTQIDAEGRLICQAGKCCVCEKDIADACPTCGTKKFNVEHNQVDVKWSNGSIMPIGVCRDCATNHKYDSVEAKQGITEAHWKYWESQGAKPDRSIVIV